MEIGPLGLGFYKNFARYKNFSRGLSGFYKNWSSSRDISSGSVIFGNRPCERPPSCCPMAFPLPCFAAPCLAMLSDMVAAVFVYRRLVRQTRRVLGFPCPFVPNERDTGTTKQRGSYKNFSRVVYQDL